tara:strand:+ start:134 stop:1657 length:1524 start_codon:yes stop_codon:yes gene_type:complete
MIKKIINLKNIKKVIDRDKNYKKKIVLCHGVFDIIHSGHISYFNSSKKNGDILVVSVTPKKFVEKGFNRPLFNDIQRVSFLSNLSIIDYVVLNNTKNAEDVIKRVKPDFYCKGPDYKNLKQDITGQIKNETNLVKSYGGKVIFTEDETFSSSKIINKFGATVNHEQKTFLNKLRSKENIEKKLVNLKDLSNLNVLVIGEIIIDKYVFSESIGKSGKEPHLVIKELDEKIFLGGAGAVANHISGFCKKINLISSIGHKKEYIKFIKKNLAKNIKTNFLFKKKSPTIEKKRYLDKVSNTKILGVYNLNDNKLDATQEKLFKKYITDKIKKADLVIVSDYGHGFISKGVSKLICNKAKFLALNTQINAFNTGYHSLKKYQKVDFLIINEKELRYELREKDLKIEQLIKKAINHSKIKNLMLTRGKNGSVFYSKKTSKFYYCPAFASKVVDKVGAGDTMLSIVAPLIKNNFDIKFSMFIGALSAAQSVESISNSLILDKLKLIKYTKYMLK